jgi:hypothetical protein
MVQAVSFGVTVRVFETGMFAKDTIVPVSKRRTQSQIVTGARRLRSLWNPARPLNLAYASGEFIGEGIAQWLTTFLKIELNGLRN